MNRKKLSIAVGLFSVLFLCMSCMGNKSKSTLIVNENTRFISLALRAGIYADVIESCLPEFELEHNVKCSVLKLSEEALHARVASANEKHDAPLELCMVDGSWMAECTSKGSLLNLSKYFYELDDDIIPATKKICYDKGQLYLAPYYGNVTVLLFNKMLLKFTGYDVSQINSLEDLYTICSRAKKSRNLGFMYRGDTNNNIVVDFLPILLSYGGWVVDENNHPTINTMEFINAVYFYKRLIATGKADSKENLIMAVANGAAAMGIAWPGWYTPSKKSACDYVALNGKAASNSPMRNANVYGIWTIGVPASTRYPDLSVKLIQYLMDAQVQKKTVPLGGVPCRYSSLKDPEILEKYPQYEAVCSALEGGIYRPIMEGWSEFYTILGEEMKEILAGNISVEDGAQKAQRRLDEIF